MLLDDPIVVNVRRNLMYEISEIVLYGSLAGLAYLGWNQYKLWKENEELKMIIGGLISEKFAQDIRKQMEEDDG